MSSSIDTQLLRVASSYSFYSTTIAFIVGSIGHILNILVFTKLTIFRGNRCAFYLVVESVTSIIILFQNCVPQIFQEIYEIDPKNYLLFWCKLRTILGQSCRLIIDYTVCFEAFDQYLSTNPDFRLRQLSTLTMAQYLVLSSICISIPHGIPFVIFYDLVPPFGCIIINQALTRYYSYFYYPVLHGLVPILISSIFGILAYRNVRRIVRRQIPVERRRLDRQLTAMIFAHVLSFVFFLLMYTTYRIFMLNVTFSPTDRYPYAVDQLFSALADSMMIIGYALNFYIFLATSSRYRRQVKYFLVKKCWHSLKRWCNSSRNEVHPCGVNSNPSGMEMD